MQVRIGVASAPAQLGRLPVHAVNRVYVTSIRASGGLPFIVPTLEPGDAHAVVAELHGLVLSGGGDLEPATYGGVAGPDLYGVDGERDRWELALVAAAEEIGVPVLGICRGLQALNVAAGGTLVPHLPACSDQAHRVIERDREVVHAVSVVAGSRLYELTGPACGVNSLHHQAADRIGSGLRAVGHAPDGVIEALEDTRGGRTLGVQWHPELLRDQPEQLALWTWLIASAATWRSRRSRVSPTPSPATEGPVPASEPGNLTTVPVNAPHLGGDAMPPRSSAVAGQAA